jgi:hypothetical protein
METTPFDSIDGTTIAMLAGSLLFFLGLMLLLQGWLMKLAVGWCGGEIGTFYGIFVVVVSMIVSVASTVGVTAFTEQPSTWTTMGCSVGASVLAIAGLTRIGILQSIGAYLIHAIMSGVATFAMFLIAVFGIGAAIPKNNMEQWTKLGKEQLQRVEGLSLGGLAPAVATESEVTKTVAPQKQSDKNPTTEEITASLQQVLFKQGAVAGTPESKNSQGGKADSAPSPKKGKTVAPGSNIRINPHVDSQP